MVHGKPILLLLALIVLQSSISVHAAVFPALTPADFNGKNFVLFLTDQERDPLFFGKAWTDANLPGYNRLKKNGILFKRAFTNACMCTPARTTLLSGYMPAQHGAKYTLQANMPNTTFPQVDLPTPAQGIDNIATMATAAGYNFVFKGKLHVNKAAEPDFVWAPSDATSYGFTRWNTPDAGANQSFSEAGGAPAYNDDRFMFDTGATSEGHEGVLSFIKSTAAKKQPFFLVVSLVNPHDVLFYPTQFAQTYKNQSWLEGTLKLPATTFENITWPNKPKAQEQFNNIYSLGGAVKTPQARLEYLNFYGNLIKSSDAYLVNMLDAMDDAGLTDDTVVIRSADHGEMAMTHGGQRQKMFNMYEDSLRVPLIYSNPKLFPEPRESYALVSHVDFVPTMSTLMGTPAKSRKANWPGIDYSGIVMGARRGAQDYIVFTFDDYQAGQARGPYVSAVSNIRAIREHRYKFAKYFDPSGIQSSEYEMYDLKEDPQERTNLASPIAERTAQQEIEYQRLKKRLTAVFEKKLQPVPLARPITLTAITASEGGLGPVVNTRGNVTNVPIGKGKISIVLQLGKTTATNTFEIIGQIGRIRGNSTMTVTVDGDNITFKGKTDITSGWGAFKNIRGKGLTYIETQTKDGQNGKVSITGTAYY